MSHSIKHLFHINAEKEKVFNAISSIDGLSQWWTAQTEGNAAPGGVIKFRFAESGGPDMKVTRADANQSVAWECIDSPHGWTGHTFNFDLDENEGKTRVQFSHNGWSDENEFYAICTFAWGRYMESLRQLCQTGKGEGFGTAGYRM
jgi:uncharacterized protein YndB with AHSA1/START domain